MGRYKKEDEVRATPVTFSLNHTHREMLGNLEKILDERKSTIIQRLIEQEFYRMVKDDKI